ncbi:MAG TPA: hypothetical protein VG410_14785 [Solirubrobacteraceae bacterium]|nr:hypothetical protein [Solirubrobacteraceae bacterium]
MPIELTAAQAETVARLAKEVGPVSLHQIADGQDVYVAGVGEPTRYLIAADGEAAPTHDE